MKFSKTRQLAAIAAAVATLTLPAPVIPSGYAWSRPADWLPAPTFAAGENKICGILGVPNAPGGYKVAFGTATLSGSTYTVDWGDGSAIATVNSGSTAEHTYDYSSLANPATAPNQLKQVAVTIKATDGSSLTTFSTYRPTGDTLTPAFTWLEMVVRSPSIGNGFTLTNMTQLQRFELKDTWAYDAGNLFNNCTSLQEVVMNTTGKTTFTSWFGSCWSLKKFPSLDLSSATAVNSMFYNSGLVEAPDLVLPNVTTVASMFSSCFALVKVGSINAAVCTNWSNFVSSCPLLEQVGSLTTPAATNMGAMFQGCYSLRAIPAISSTASVTTMQSMFSQCYFLDTVPPLDYSKVTDATGLFQYAAIVSVKGLSLPLVTSVSSMFANCPTLKSVDMTIGPNCTNFSSLFNGCKNLVSVPSPSAMPTSKGTNFANMFSTCQSLQTVPLYDFSAGTNFSNLFQNCAALRSIPAFNFGQALTTNYMFSGSGVTTIPALSFANVTNANSMFANSQIETCPDLSFPLATDVGNLFTGCQRLAVPPNISAPVATTAASIFQNCGKIKRTGTLTLPACTNMSSAFNGCTMLMEISMLNMAPLTSLSGLVAANGLMRFGGSGATQSFSLQNTTLRTAALTEVFTNLGTASPGATITITGCPGAAAGSGLDRTIATNKGWTVTG